MRHLRMIFAAVAAVLLASSVIAQTGTVTTTGVSPASGVAITATSATYPDVTVTTGANATFHIFSASNELMRVGGANGNVGIGAQSPSAILTVQRGSATTLLGLSGDATKYTDIGLGRTAMEARLGIASNDVGEYSVTAKRGDAVLRVDDASKRLLLLAGYGDAVMTITSTGVGIGTTPSLSNSRLEIGSSLGSAQFQDMIGALGVTGMKLNMTGNSEIDVAGIQIGNTAMPTINVAGGNLNLQYAVGDVNIGNGTHGNLTVGGNVTVNGTVYANYQDVAEWVPASESMPAGTVVVISDATNNTVTPSASAYDTGVAGVVSPSPGLLLGVAGASKAKIATTGRVRVRADATKHPIRKGDLLVTSDRPGMAMKSEPLDLGGVKIHRPGTLIGKALEPLPGGEGEILVLLSLQ